MKVVFFSNYLNHHQLPFCLAMDALTNHQFTFVATENIPDERLALGYEDMNKMYPFVLIATDDAEQNSKEKAMQLALNCDVVIHGCAPEIYYLARKETNGITFRYSERLIKKNRILLDPRFYRLMHYHASYADKPFYMLCASAFTADDFGRFHAYRDKCYRWGYFPKAMEYDINQLWAYKQKQNKPIIVWVARMIPWKHPETAIKAALFLKEHGIDYELRIIGKGRKEKAIQRMIQRYELTDYIRMCGSMKPDEVRVQMEMASVLLVTSDKNEGWGAVVNEGMNSGCVVVANCMVGSASFLIRDEENGMIYPDRSQQVLNDKLLKLLVDHEKMQRIGKAAYHTIVDEWNAENAAARLLALSNQLLNEDESPFVDGPCSKAIRISDCMARKMYHS